MSKLTLAEAEEDTAGQTDNQLYPESLGMELSKLCAHMRHLSFTKIGVISSSMDPMSVRNCVCNKNPVRTLYVFNPPIYQENQAVMGE